MRVVSLVPSWTETLIEAGAHVVGRTRFCIHPAQAVRGIPAVGGTKDLNLEKIKRVAPDLIILDREENTREMADSLREIAPLHVSHVRSVNEMPRELRALGKALTLVENFETLAKRFEQVLSPPPKAVSLSSSLAVGNGAKAFAYIIWKDPWMCVSHDTFIASMLERAGYDLKRLWTPAEATRYPAFTLDSLPNQMHLLLSSEPFPFEKKLDAVRELLQSEALASKALTFELVDGESFSWFGLRALRFLEALKC